MTNFNKNGYYASENVYLTVSLYQHSDSLSDDVLILKCMADENFDALLTLLGLIYLSWIIKLQEE